MSDTLIASAAATMWDPSLLPANAARTVGDLHEEIEKLASLFDCQPPGVSGVDLLPFLPTLASGPSLSLTGPTEILTSSFRHVASTPEQASQEEPFFLANWQPKTLRETELLLIIDDLQSKLKKEREKVRRFEHTVMEQRHNLDITQASEKFYKLKATKLEAQLTSKRRQPSTGRSAATRTFDASLGNRTGRPRRVRPPAVDDDAGRVPFSRITDRRNSRSASQSRCFDQQRSGNQSFLAKVPSQETSPAFAANNSFAASSLFGNEGGVALLTGSSVFGNPPPQDSYLRQQPSMGPRRLVEDLDFLGTRGVHQLGAMSDSEVNCRNTSDDTIKEDVVPVSSSARRRSSSANRVREVMQSIGFLSARSSKPENVISGAAPHMESNTAASTASTPSHRSKGAVLSAGSPCPGRPIAHARLSNMSSSATESINIAQAIANERLRCNNEWPVSGGSHRHSPSGSEFPLPAKTTGSSSCDSLRLSRQPQSTSTISSGPLDIDQRLSSLRQLILQATAHSSSAPPSLNNLAANF